MSGWGHRDGLTVHVTQGSGSSFRPALAPAQLGIAHRLRFVDVPGGETRQPAFMAIDGMGQVPHLVDRDGCGPGESDAMLWCIAEGSALVPADPMDRAETTPGFVPIDRLPGPERDRAGRADNLAA